MGSEWREVQLGELADEITVGHVGPMPAYVEGGIPFLRSQNVDRLRINDSDFKSISSSSHDRLRKSVLHPGDVVIVRTGRPGACAVIPPSLPIANCSDLVIVRPGRELDPWFLAYYINSAAVHGVTSQVVGAVQQHFNIGSARNLTIRLPDLATQREVVEILRALDDKIELNRRMIQTLESMARALFKSWFVDFEFSLQPPAASWPVGCITELADVVGGNTPPTAQSAYWHDGRHRFATPKDLATLDSPALLDTSQHITDAGLIKVSSGLLPAGTVLLSSRAPIGYRAICENPVAINQGFIALRPRAGVPSLFLYLWLETKTDEIQSRANGSTFLEISKSSFRGIQLVLPPPPVLSAFGSATLGLRSRLSRLSQERTQLASIRDCLLPELMSGRLAVN